MPELNQMQKFDHGFVGRIVGLAQAAEELRGRQSDTHFVNTLIQYAREYSKDTGFAANGWKESSAAENAGMTETQYRQAESLYLHGDLSGR
jgi:hypothetical protein